MSFKCPRFAGGSLGPAAGRLAVALGAREGDDEKIDCGPLKADAQQLKTDRAACADGDECVFITTSHDCTGELGCDTPVNEKVVAEPALDSRLGLSRTR